MQIKADDEGIKAIEQLTDAFLKTNGNSGLQLTLAVLQSTTKLEEVNDAVQAEKEKETKVEKGE